MKNERLKFKIENLYCFWELIIYTREYGKKMDNEKSKFKNE